jgi:hypothetical protein
MVPNSACLTDEQISEVSIALAIKIWERWHGPMAKVPGSHDECVNSLRLMLQEYNEATAFLEKYNVRS